MHEFFHLMAKTRMGPRLFCDIESLITKRPAVQRGGVPVGSSLHSVVCLFTSSGVDQYRKADNRDVKPRDVLSDSKCGQPESNCNTIFSCQVTFADVLASRKACLHKVHHTTTALFAHKKIGIGDGHVSLPE